MTNEQRLVYRQRKDLQATFINPYNYYQWWSYHERAEKPQDIDSLEKQLAQCKELICAMESSKFWKIRNLWFDFKKILGLAH